MTDSDTIKKWIELLEKHWDVDATLYHIREGIFDESGLAKLEETLQEVDFGTAKMLDVQIVPLLWYISLLLEWNRGRVEEWSHKSAELQPHIEKIEAHLLRILGDPRLGRKEGSEGSVYEDQIRRLCEEWQDNGFFGKLGRGIFDSSRVEEIKRVLDSVTWTGDQPLDRTLVSLIWYIPVFLERQNQYLHECSGSNASHVVTLRRLTDSVVNHVQDVLGIP